MFLLLIVTLFIPIVEYNHIGCFKTDSGPLIPSLEGTDPLLDGDFTTRVDVFKKCLNAARREDNTVFAIKNGGECLSSSGNLTDVIAKYAPSNMCVNNKGGLNAMDFYFVIGEGIPTFSEFLDLNFL